jgi:hypothetical protein
MANGARIRKQLTRSRNPRIAEAYTKQGRLELGIAASLIRGDPACIAQAGRIAPS